MQSRLFAALCLLAIGCSPARQLSRSAKEQVLNDPALRSAHVGISVYDPAKKAYLYNYQGDRYFVPASNTKLPTLYAALKYLGDSLVGLKVRETPHEWVVEGTGDPTLLHPDFQRQPVVDFLRTLSAGKPLLWQESREKVVPFGSGWAWNDYEASYMAERSALPIYGNLVRFSGPLTNIRAMPSSFSWQASSQNGHLTDISREVHRNLFRLKGGGQSPREISLPFMTSDTLNFRLLLDTLKRTGDNTALVVAAEESSKPYTYTVHSQPADSLLKPLMHRSDNFFAEQTLLMASHRLLGVMNEARLIDTLLKTHLSDLPQKPRWVDGSGLSRYNLFTPQDLVMILDKMQREYGMERMKVILPTGNEGTLTNYYKEEAGLLFGKTGTLSGVVALSGYLYTKENRLLIFSVLVNNHNASATAVRRAVEKFIKTLR